MRTHNTDKLSLVLHDCIQKRDSYIRKPVGLWYGVDNEWLDWCKSEMPGWVKPYNYILELDLSKMLIINNQSKFLDFHREYSYSRYPDIHIHVSNCSDIDWVLVAKKYSGIEISPYLWECRLEFSWYYGWDCASGCVWDKSIVKSVECEVLR